MHASIRDAERDERRRSVSTAPEWEEVPQADGTSWEIRRAPSPDPAIVHEPTVFGSVRVTDRGWIAAAIDGRTYGPFTSLSEAAYPLALAGDGQDARLLLGVPLPAGRLEPTRAAVAAPVQAPNHEKRNRRLLSVALLAITVLAIVVERRGSTR
jgi:hypothetical protein